MDLPIKHKLQQIVKNDDVCSYYYLIVKNRNRSEARRRQITLIDVVIIVLHSINVYIHDWCTTNRMSALQCMQTLCHVAWIHITSFESSNHPVFLSLSSLVQFVNLSGSNEVYSIFWQS